MWLAAAACALKTLVRLCPCGPQLTQTPNRHKTLTLQKTLPGIDRSRVEDMEARLKADVLREAARYEQHILVTEEDDDMNVSLLRV